MFSLAMRLVWTGINGRDRGVAVPHADEDKEVEPERPDRQLDLAVGQAGSRRSAGDELDGAYREREAEDQVG